MSVIRVMGTEVEYGISLPTNPNANAMLLSAQIVNGYASMLPGGRRRTANDTGAKVDEIRSVANDNGGRGSGAVRVRSWSPRA